MEDKALRFDAESMKRVGKGRIRGAGDAHRIGFLWIGRESEPAEALLRLRFMQDLGSGQHGDASFGLSRLSLRGAHTIVDAVGNAGDQVAPFGEEVDDSFRRDDGNGLNEFVVFFAVVQADNDRCSVLDLLRKLGLSAEPASR